MGMFDYLYLPQEKFEKIVSYEMDEKFDNGQLAEVISAYQQDLFLDADNWFERMKDLGEKIGYCPNMKEYKKNPDNYKGSVADLCTIVRIAVTGHKNSPDLHTIMRLLGAEMVQRRLECFLAQL